jgi:hypothetical protein
MIQQDGRIRLLIEMFLYTTVLLADNENFRADLIWASLLTAVVASPHNQSS